MPADPVRAAALEIIERLEREGHTLDHYLNTLVSPEQFPQRRDRNLIYALVYGVARWRLQLDWIIAQFSRIPLSKIEATVITILRLALFQIFHLQRVPPSAAVNTAVALTRERVGARATGFVNAVLRNAFRQKSGIVYPDPRTEPIQALSVTQAHPEWLVRRWIERHGMDQAERLCRANNQIAPLTLRVNTIKASREALIGRLRTAGYAAEATPFSPWGVHVGGRDAGVLQSDVFRQGWFQVQDEAAQLVAMILAPRPGETILDACAGRGGKSANLAQMMENRGRIVAADRVTAKLDALESEMARLTVSIVERQVRDFEGATEASGGGHFDHILLDAPCSGMGVLRRHPEAKWRLSPLEIDRHARRQQRLLAGIAALLKPGGVLVYAVCSTEPEETRAVVDRFLERQSTFQLEPVLPHLPAGAEDMVDARGCFRTRVDRHGVDGFFAARLRHQIDSRA